MTDQTKLLREALQDARKYVEGAYEAAFPNEDENDRVLAQIDAALSTVAQPSDGEA